MTLRPRAVAAGLALAIALAATPAPAHADETTMPNDYQDSVAATAVATADLARTAPAAVSDEMKYFTLYESGKNYDQGFSRWDDYHAMGYYQFDRRYALVGFMRYCVSADAATFSMFEPVLARASELSNPQTVIYDVNAGALTELGQLAEDAWHEAYAADPSLFSALQDTYAVTNYYEPTARWLARRGIDLSGRADCVKGLVWSLTNLFGTGGVQKYLAAANLSATMSDRAFVNAIVDSLPASLEAYNANTRYHASWINRYEQERATCLAYIAEDEAAAGVSAPDAGDADDVPVDGTLNDATLNDAIAPDTSADGEQSGDAPADAADPEQADGGDAAPGDADDAVAATPSQQAPDAGSAGAGQDASAPVVNGGSQATDVEAVVETEGASSEQTQGTGDADEGDAAVIGAGDAQEQTDDPAVADDTADGDTAGGAVDDGTGSPTATTTSDDGAAGTDASDDPTADADTSHDPASQDPASDQDGRDDAGEDDTDTEHEDGAAADDPAVEPRDGDPAADTDTGNGAPEPRTTADPTAAPADADANAAAAGRNGEEAAARAGMPVTSDAIVMAVLASGSLASFGVTALVAGKRRLKG